MQHAQVEGQQREDDADEGELDPGGRAHEVGCEEGEQEVHVLFSDSEDRRDGRARAHQGADHTEQHDIAFLIAQAPGVEGDTDQREGQDGEEKRAGVHGDFVDQEMGSSL
jgi:hypothetical protein